MSDSPEKKADSEVERSKVQLYVAHISRDVSERSLKKEFGRFGEITDLNMKRGFAFIVIYTRNLDLRRPS